MKFDDLWKIENNSKLIIHDENIFNMVDDKVALTSMRLEDFQLVDDDICFNLIDLKYYKISKFNDDFELIDIDNIYKKYVDAKKSVDYLDELTWVLSRKFVFKKYLEYLKYAFQFNEEFAVIIGDIDHFKKFNDTFGHSFGDKVLVSVASVLNNSVRNSDVRTRDLVGRYGGEEFLIVLKNINDVNALNVCENLRCNIQNNNVDNESVTMSFGMFHVDHSFIEEYKFQDNNHNYQELARLLFDLADKELYNAKIDRNLVSSNVKIKKEKSR